MMTTYLERGQVQDVDLEGDDLGEVGQGILALRVTW